MKYQQLERLIKFTLLIVFFFTNCSDNCKKINFEKFVTSDPLKNSLNKHLYDDNVWGVIIFNKYYLDSNLLEMAKKASIIDKSNTFYYLYLALLIKDSSERSVLLKKSIEQDICKFNAFALFELYKLYKIKNYFLAENYLNKCLFINPYFGKAVEEKFNLVIKSKKNNDDVILKLTKLSELGYNKANNLLGQFYFSIKNRDSSYYYFSKSLSIEKNFESYLGLGDLLGSNSFILGQKYYDSALIYNKDIKNLVYNSKAKLFSMNGPNQNLDSSISYLSKSVNIQTNRESLEDLLILLIEKNENSKIEIQLKEYFNLFGKTKDYYFLQILYESKKGNYKTSQAYINQFYKDYYKLKDIEWLKAELGNWNITIK